MSALLTPSPAERVAATTAICAAPTGTEAFVNIAAYKFVSFNDTEARRADFLNRCNGLELKGTILLSPEGINLFLAGYRDNIDQFLHWLRDDTRFTDIEVKESFSEKQPFTRMLVKLKKEIITMKHPLIRPEEGRAPAVDAATLKQWLDRGTDDAGRPVVMMDTRNAFEVDVGTFSNALDYRIEKFSEFPDIVAAQQTTLADKTVVTFCTGGIRCEKAAIYMQNVEYENVYQLDGGILKYFEVNGGDHYEGDCFVFDYRTSVNPRLEETATAQCFACRHVVTPREQLSAAYVPGKSCPHCLPEDSPSAE